MTERDFRQLLQARFQEGKFVCVGLDSDLDKIPMMQGFPLGSFGRQDGFNQAIVNATWGEVCAYKPNTAFYEAQGKTGIRDLRATISHIHKVAPGVVVIVDAKRADIGNTNDGYAKFVFDYLGADAITVHPYLGKEALAPFLDRADKGVIVLCRTSNPGAGELQDRRVLISPDEGRVLRKVKGETDAALWEVVAHNVANHWNDNGNCAVVVGATYPGELGKVREIVGDMPILIPGVGAQGGDLEEAVRNGRSNTGSGMIINASRSVIFASSAPDFADAAAAEVKRMNQVVRSTLGVAA